MTDKSEQFLKYDYALVFVLNSFILAAHFVYSHSLPRTRLKTAFIVTSIQSRGLEQRCQTALYQNTSIIITHTNSLTLIYNEVRLPPPLCLLLVFPCIFQIGRLVDWI